MSESSPRKQAARDGRVTYEGGLCARCGGCERYVSNGACVPCTRLGAKKSHERVRDLRRQRGVKEASS